MNALQTLVETHQAWLTDRIVAYATSHGYGADLPLVP